MGEEMDEKHQRPAPGKMKQSRRSRNSGGSSSGLPYTVHDLTYGPPSPASAYDDESPGSLSASSSQNALRQTPSDDSALGSPVSAQLR